MVNDHTRSAENWKCVWYLLRLYIYIRVYVDSHSLGQLALASKRTASIYIYIYTLYIYISPTCNMFAHKYLYFKLDMEYFFFFK